MKLVRFTPKQAPASTAPSWGLLEGSEVFALQGDPLGAHTRGARVCALADLRLVAPCTPTKVIAAAINFHGATDWEPGMVEPVFFLKAPSSLTGPTDDIVSNFTDVPTWGEAELAIVIGKQARRLASIDDAEAHIFGYTVANDASCENLGTRDHHLARSKAADAFCPTGPYVDTEYEWKNRRISAFHNGVLVRDGTTDKMFWDPHRIVYELSQWMTLEPWDLVLTGSPPLSCPLTYLNDGDRFLSRVEGFPEIESSFVQRRPLDPAKVSRWITL